MAGKIIDFYRITWEPSGIQTPVITKSQTMTEIENAMNIISGNMTLSFSITQLNMSIEEFKKRPQEMRNHGFAGTMN